MALVTSYAKQSLSLLEGQLQLFLDKYTGKGSTTCVRRTYHNGHWDFVGKPVWPGKLTPRYLPLLPVTPDRVLDLR